MTGLSPKDYFEVYMVQPISDVQQKSLNVLYRPLLTSNSFSLFIALQELYAANENKQNIHTVLLNWLGIDIKKIEEARGQLEAIGLLKTYKKQIDNNSLFIYKLQNPLSPINFLKDDTLSSLLLNVIGENEYQAISQQFIVKSFNSTGFYDISKKLTDCYFLGESVVNTNPIIKKVKNSLFEDESKIENLNTNFDFNLLIKILSNSFVDAQSLLDNRHLIMVQQTLYGIDEENMAKIIVDSTDFSTNKIDAKKLKQNVLIEFSNNHRHVDKTVQIKYNSSEFKSLNVEEQKVIKLMYNVSPIEFLRSVKSSVGGFPTSAEERIIESLINTNMIPVSVINFLVYYLLVDQGNATLNKNLTETIANNWIKNKIKNPVEALKFVRQRLKQNSIKRKNNSRSRKVIQRETLPDWAQKKQNINKPTININKTNQDINDRLNKIKMRGKKGR